MFLFVFWLSNRPSIKHLCNWGNGGEVHPKCVQVRKRGEVYHASCVRTHLRYLFSCFCLMVSCFICRNLTLPSFRKGVFVRNGSISVVMKVVFLRVAWRTFQSEPKKMEKIRPQKNSLYFRKWKFCSDTEKFLYFFKRKLFLNFRK